MKLHANAPHGPRGRAEMVRRVLQGHTAGEVAKEFGVSRRTVRKWLARYRTEGEPGLEDRTSRPHRTPTAIPAAVRVRIEQLRRERWTGAQIATKVGRSPATVHRVLQQLGLERLRKLDREPSRVGPTRSAILGNRHAIPGARDPDGPPRDRLRTEALEQAGGHRGRLRAGQQGV